MDIRGGLHGSALQAAMCTASENPKLVQLLLDHGADPDIGGDNDWRTPLQVAVHREDEKNVELLLKRGADPSIQGGVDGNALKTARKSGNATILRVLLEWGAEDEREPDRWLSMLDKLSKPPVSHPDVSCARFLLARHFEQFTKQPSRPLTSVNLADKVIDLARYWLPDSSGRHDQVEISKDISDRPYLQVKIKNWPSPDTRVRQVVFRIKSRDQELEGAKILELGRNSPRDSSHIWFEVGIHSPNSAGLESRMVVQRSFRGSRITRTRTHNIVWDLNNCNSQILKFIANLKPGDVMDIFAKSSISTHTHVNYVDSMEVIVFYSHQSGSTSR